MDKACGVVCEYDPFHNGHAYQIAYAREQLGLPVVCAMSGDYTERGLPACADKAERARIAVENGASLVLEIPFPYCAAPARIYAEAGVRILAASGLCSHLVFGSESGDLALLEEIAAFLAHKETEPRIRALQKADPTLSYASARERLARETLGQSAAAALRAPNDILAVEYLRTIRLHDYPLTPLALKRTVSRDKTDGTAGFASSSAVRALLEAGSVDEAAAFVPRLPQSFDPALRARLKTVIHASVMTRNAESLAEAAECGGGLAARLAKAAKDSRCYDETVKAMRAKNLTDAKIRRMLLFAFFGVTPEVLQIPCPYAFVLAENADGSAKPLLRQARKFAFPVCQTVSKAKKDPAALPVYRLDRLARDVTEAVRFSLREERNESTYEEL